MTHPTLISFSGGRTSAYMLHRLLEQGQNVLALFANTGKERPETLDFVNECAVRWHAPVVWLEFQFVDVGGGQPKSSYKVVDYATAARNGEPFEALITQNKKCPSPVFRWCTDRLKIRPIRQYIKATFPADYGDMKMAIGIRADEAHRGKNQTYSKPKPIFPLLDAGITKHDVDAFWRKQPFDLRIDSRQGNCDMCFLKRRSVLVELIRQEPDRAAWWIEQEARTGTVFNRAASYADLKTMSERLRLFDLGDDVGGVSCFCTD